MHLSGGESPRAAIARRDFNPSYMVTTMLEASISLDDFLAAEELTPRQFYHMRAKGLAPRCYKAGKFRRLMLSDVTAWRLAMMDLDAANAKKLQAA